MANQITIIDQRTQGNAGGFTTPEGTSQVLMQDAARPVLVMNVCDGRITRVLGRYANMKQAKDRVIQAKR